MKTPAPISIRDMTLAEIENWFLLQDMECRSCGNWLKQGCLIAKPGYFYRVKGIPEKVDLFIRCLCGYETPIWKMIQNWNMAIINHNSCKQSVHFMTSFWAKVHQRYYLNGNYVTDNDVWFVPIGDHITDDLTIQDQINCQQANIPVIEQRCEECKLFIKGYKIATLTRLGLHADNRTE